MELKKYIYMYIDIYLYITQVVCIQDINLGVKRLSELHIHVVSLPWAGESFGGGIALEGEQQSRARLEAMICRGPYGDPMGTPLVQDWALAHPPLRLKLMVTAGRFPGATAGCCSLLVPAGVWPCLLYLGFGPVPPSLRGWSITRVSPRDHRATRHIPIS